MTKKKSKKASKKLKIVGNGEDGEVAEKSSYDDQAKALVKTNNEGFLRMYARWIELERELLNEGKEVVIAQIPDVYDSSKYAIVKTPERLYFTSESHIHSLINIVRYCNMHETLQGEDSLVCDSALDRLFKTKELDDMSYIVLRMLENTELPLEDPKRLRIQRTISQGADLSHLKENDEEGISWLQEQMEMTAEDMLPPPNLHACYLSKSGAGGYFILTHIPPEMIFKILSFLPVKPLIKFRCVSKEWNQLIVSNHFIQMHFECSTKTNKKLILRRDMFLYSATIDQENQLRINAEAIEQPPFGCEIIYPRDIVASCRGLLCIGSPDGHWGLWNPYTGYQIALPDARDDLEEFRKHYICYGMGYDKQNNDYKVVRVVQGFHDVDNRDNKVIIYSLKSKSYKRACDFPDYVCLVSSVCVNGALHFYVTNKMGTDYFPTKIASFDLVSERYELVAQPPDHDKYKTFSLGEFAGCLSLTRRSSYDPPITDIWIMKEYGVGDSWSHMFHLRWPDYNIRPRQLTYLEGTHQILLLCDDDRIRIMDGEGAYLVEIYGTTPCYCHVDEEFTLDKFDEFYVCTETFAGYVDDR